MYQTPATGFPQYKLESIRKCKIAGLREDKRQIESRDRCRGSFDLSRSEISTKTAPKCGHRLSSESVAFRGCAKFFRHIKSLWRKQTRCQH